MESPAFSEFFFYKQGVHDCFSLQQYLDKPGAGFPLRKNCFPVMLREFSIGSSPVAKSDLAGIFLAVLVFGFGDGFDLLS